MFKVPMYNFAYDYDNDRFFLESPAGAQLKKIVTKLRDIIYDHFLIDFTMLTEENIEMIRYIRTVLHSEYNNNSNVLYHLINYYSINVRRSNKEEEVNMLHIICACGRLEDVVWYLNSYPKVKVNTLSHILQSPLQFAVAIGNSPDIALYLCETKGARFYPEKWVDELFEEEGVYTIVDALCVQWEQQTGSFYSTWEFFGDLVCGDVNMRELIKIKLPQFYSFLRSDMVI